METGTEIAYMVTVKFFRNFLPVWWASVAATYCLGRCPKLTQVPNQNITKSPFDWMWRPVLIREFWSISSRDLLSYVVSFYTHKGAKALQRWTKRLALGCEKFLPGLAWLFLSKTGPPFSPSLLRAILKWLPHQEGEDGFQKGDQVHDVVRISYCISAPNAAKGRGSKKLKNTEAPEMVCLFC